MPVSGGIVSKEENINIKEVVIKYICSQIDSVIILIVTLIIEMNSTHFFNMLLNSFLSFRSRHGI